MEHFSAVTTSIENGLHAKVILKGSCQQQIHDQLTWSIRQNQFCLLCANQPEIRCLYKPGMHISMDVFFGDALMQEMHPLFPGLQPSLLLFPAWADTELLDITHSLLRSQYEKIQLRYFLNNRVRDLLLKLLAVVFKKQDTEIRIGEKELQAIHEAEQLITNNLTQHLHIPELARQVLLNQYSLKKYFKQVFGMGPYEYLTRKRLEKAKELLQQGRSVKEVAGYFGYRPSHFTTSFRRFHGYNPGTVNKQKP